MSDEVPNQPAPEENVGGGEQAQPEPKSYEPPNPTIKECIQLSQLMPVIDIECMVRKLIRL